MLHSMFEENKFTRGGVRVFLFGKPFQSRTIRFEECVFRFNINWYKHKAYKPHHKRTTGNGHGGGLMFQFNSARDVYVEVLRCQFTNNSALWGGGLFVSFRSLAVGNKSKTLCLLTIKVQLEEVACTDSTSLLISYKAT